MHIYLLVGQVLLVIQFRHNVAKNGYKMWWWHFISQRSKVSFAATSLCAAEAPFCSIIPQHDSWTEGDIFHICSFSVLHDNQLYWLKREHIHSICLFLVSVNELADKWTYESLQKLCWAGGSSMRFSELRAFALSACCFSVICVPHLCAWNVIFMVFMRSLPLENFLEW